MIPSIEACRVSRSITSSSVIVTVRAMALVGCMPELPSRRYSSWNINHAWKLPQPVTGTGPEHLPAIVLPDGRWIPTRSPFTTFTHGGRQKAGRKSRSFIMADIQSINLALWTSDVSGGSTGGDVYLSLIHISEPTRRTPISYA